MALGTEQQKLAVDSGVWPLYRFDPRRIAAGESPLQLDSGAPKIRGEQYMKNENRFRMLEKLGSERARAMAGAAQREADRRYRLYQQLAAIRTDDPASAAKAVAAVVSSAPTAAPATPSTPSPLTVEP